MISPESIALENNSILLDLGYRIPAHLPNIESISELKPQTAKSAATRAVVLVHFVMLGNDWPLQRIVSFLEEFDLTNTLSERENSLLSEPLSEQDRIDCTWLSEGLQVFSWCFETSELCFEKYCDDDLASKLPVPFTNPKTFIEMATLRPFEDIYKMADLHYRYHWLSRDSQRQPIPLHLSKSAISERRKALDWIIGTNPDWDAISMDT